MEHLQAFLHELVALFADTAPWLLVGFVLAGVLKVIVPERWIEGHLGGKGPWPVLRASLYGVPIPLCSCSVIPTAASLRSAGASKGATTSFLISTPETGVDSISVTYALLDPLMTVVRPVVAFITAVVTGLLVNLLGALGWDEPSSGGGAVDGCADHDHAVDDCCADEAEPRGRLRQVLHFAFVTLLDDLALWLLVGFVLSALFAGFVPDTFFTESVPAGLPSMLLMMLLATPIYICATASTPIAAVLIAKGLNPGAALVFLLVGPATNVTTLLVVRRLLGGRSLAVYLGGIMLVALAAGLAVDALYAGLDLDLSGTVAATMAEEHGTFALVCAGLLALLMAVSLARTFAARRASKAKDDPGCC